MTAPFITFCIPFYKGLEYLKEALQSVLNQTTPLWRCIVVDDAGPESGIEELVLSMGDSRFSYVKNNQNLGLAGNWNRCLELAKTPLVSLFHADDRLGPRYAEIMLNLAAEYPQALAYFCRTRIINATGQEVFSFADQFKKILMPARDQVICLEGEDGLAAIMRGNFIFCPTLCFHREQLHSEPFNKRWRMVLDLDWIAQALLNNHLLVGTPEVAYDYRRHNENQSSILTKSKLRFVEEIEIHRIIAKQSKDKNWHKAAAAAHMMMSVRLHMGFQICLCLLKFKWGQAFGFARVLGASCKPMRRYS
jgi:glycosyltransferase involved in cell wall biosynthesis